MWLIAVAPFCSQHMGRVNNFFILKVAAVCKEISNFVVGLVASGRKNSST